jgi:hypothetical protein
MLDNASLVSRMSEDTFAEVIQASPRKIRETLFARLGIKAKKQIGLKVHAKTEERTRKLHERLKTAETKQEDELCQELVRNWLYTKRPMLKAVLDHLGVKNDNGLVDEEPTFFTELTPEKVRAIFDALKGQYPVEHLATYLRFVKTPHVDDVEKQAA